MSGKRAKIYIPELPTRGDILPRFVVTEVAENYDRKISYFIAFVILYIFSSKILSYIYSGKNIFAIVLKLNLMFNVTSAL